MMPKFEEYRRSSGRIGSSQMVFTLQRGGQFSINDRAYDAIGRPETVVLLFDPEDQIIGLRAAPPDHPHAYLVQAAASGVNFMINGVGFCKFYNIPTEQGRRYTATAEDKVLMVDLKSEAAMVFSNRFGSRAQTGDADEQAHLADR